jgi:glycosyltransferase involved in cell wall biosynthesis
MPFFSPYPHFSTENPFLLHWLYAMEEHGWKAQPFIWWPISLLKYRYKIPVILFHFPDVYWRTDLLKKAKYRLFKFKAMIRLAKMLGYKLVWCANNVLPHDARYPDFEKAQRKWIMRNFDLIVGFARNTCQELEHEFGPLKIPFASGVHGNYEGLYPPSKSREELIQDMELDSQKIKILLLLSDKPYKGNLSFLKTWSSGHYPNLQLVLAGPAPDSMKDLIEKLCGDVRYISKHKRVSHYLLGDLYYACDIIGLPYRRITTSGAYMLALTLEKPVLAADLPFFKMHTDSDTAVLYSATGGDKALADAFDLLNRGEFNKNSEAIRRLKQTFTWKNCANSIAPAFDRLIGL